MKILIAIAVLALAAFAAEAQTRTNVLAAGEFIIYALPSTNWNASYVRATPLGFNFNRRLQINVEVWRPTGIIDRKVLTMPPAIIRQWTAATNNTPKRFLANWIMTHPDMETVLQDQTAVNQVEEE